MKWKKQLWVFIYNTYHMKYCKFWRTFVGLFIEHKPWNWEKWLKRPNSIALYTIFSSSEQGAQNPKLIMSLYIFFNQTMYTLYCSYYTSVITTSYCMTMQKSIFFFLIRRKKLIQKSSTLQSQIVTDQVPEIGFSGKYPESAEKWV